MAQLTADDVVLKGFQTTKFREGYDQEEVDDFLDEVALSMRTLTAENDDLKSKLAAAELRIAELEAAAADLLPEAVAAPGGAPGRPAPAPIPVPVPAPNAVPEPSRAAPGGPSAFTPPVAAPAVAAAPLPEEESATGMLALARKLHDQYVQAGQEEGDQILSEAKAKATGIVREAEETAQRTKARLEKERSDLEREIEGLRIFERDYRTRLRTYLSNLLSDIDGSKGDQKPVDALGGS
ncbi:MAG: DivIVA domain-containing protein [Bifidobacteriaceae bacterium]|jgi:DivIVA domain-containing protein|nr:DivIVA domain-containing protein [Bifidobacteriaceae bacterium]